MTVPLHLARSGRKLRLERLTGDSKTQSHLAALGFVPGVEVEVIRRGARGPCVVGIKTGRLMLGQPIAAHIWVE